MRNIFLFLTVFFVFLSVRVAAQPCKATFTIKNNVCGLVTFQADNTDPGIQYNWDFGDGATSNIAQPQHQYQSLGNGTAPFTVKLVVSKPAPNPCMSMTTQNITVTQVPDPSISDDKNLGFTRCDNTVFVIDNASTTKATNIKYRIQWGDGSPDYNASTLPDDLEHDFKKLGDYQVVVTVTGQNGCSNSKTYFFYSESKPNIGLEQVSNSVKCAPFSFAYQVTNISTNSSKTNYEFSVDDGTPVLKYTQANVPNEFNHTFLRSNCRLGLPNGFTLKVVAKNTCPTPAEATVKGVQIDEPPKADFTITPKDTNCLNEVFFFKNTTKQGYFNISGQCDSVVSGSWSITPNTGFTIENGGDLSKLDDFSARFIQPGEYTICLKVKNKGSSVCAEVSICKKICVLPKPPTSNFNTNMPAKPPCYPYTMKPTNTSNTLNSCGKATYFWEVIFDSSPCGNTSGKFNFVNGTTASSINPEITFSASGIYKVKLTVTTICGTNTAEQSITIAEAPLSTIEEVKDACVTLKVTPKIKETKNCGIAPTYQWTFDNGMPGSFTGPNPPEIMFTNSTQNPITYTIKLETSNDCGNTVTTEQFVLFPLPIVPPEISISTPRCKGQSITFNNLKPGALTYKWSGPAGFMSTKAQPDPITNVTTANAGPYIVTVTDPVSTCTNTKTFQVVVYDAPPVTIAPSSAATCINTPITLTANTQAPFVLKDWKWSPTTNMTPVAGNTPSVTVTPTSLTAVTYTVTVTDNNGCSNTASVAVNVNPKPMVTAPDITVCPDVNTTLVGSGSPAGTGTWKGVNVTPAGVFNAPAGSYMVKYIFTTTGGGCKDSVTVKVCVRNKPAATFTVDKNSGCAPLTVKTTNQSSMAVNCAATKYRWIVQFKTGVECDATAGQWSSPNINLASPEFTFQKPGVYDLMLVDSNACGKDVKTVQITVGGPPVFDIDPIPDQCKVVPENSITPKIKDLSLKACYNTILPNGGYDWQFTTGGGTPSNSNQQVPGIVKYTTIGTKTVTLKVSNGCGSATKQVTFNIVDLPKVSLAYNNTPQPPCVGSPLNITATPIPAGGTFKWQGPGGSLPNTTATLSIPSAKASDAGTYTVTYTIGGAVPCTATATVTVTVNPLPTVTVAVNPTVAAYCAGGSAMLTASGADTYAWTPVTTPPTGSTVTVNPTTSTTYTVTGTATSTGCKNTATATVTVHPIPTITVPSNLTLCANTSTPTPLGGSGTPAGTGVWTGPNVTNGAFNGPPGTYTATYTYTTSTTPPCTATATTNICVVNVPVADFKVDTTFGCKSVTVKTINKSNTLSDCKAADYNWTVKFNGAECEPGSQGQWSPTSSTAQDPVFIFSKQGKYDLTLTVTNKCGTSTKTVSVTVGGPPQLICASVNNQCKQAMNIITPTVASKSCNGGPMSFQWSFPTADSPLNSPQEVPGAVKYLTEGLHTYTVTVTNTCGPSTCSQSFTIQPLPTPTVSANKPCVGEKLDLTIGGLAPGSGYSYKWDGPAGFTSAVANPSRNPAQQIHSGTYTVTVTLAGCTATASVTVTVNPLPVPSIVPPGSICLGQSATLKAQPDLMKDYAWGPPTDLNLTTGQTVISKPLAIPTPPRTYTVTVTDGNMCTNTASVTLTVNPLPMVKIEQPQVLCNQSIGEPLIFSPKTGGMGTWKGQHIDQMGVFTPTGLPGGTGDFPVTYIFKDSNGCTDSATVVVKVNDPVDLIMPKDTGVCINSGKFILKASHAPGTWSGAPANILNPATGEFTPSTDEVYTLTYTYGSKTCERKGTVKVTVWKRPVAKIDPVSAICLGQPATLKAQPDLMKDYAWGPPTDLNLTTGQTVISKLLAIPTPPRTYTVTVTDGNMCTNTASVTLTVNPLPMVKIEQPQVLCNQSIGEPLIFSPKTGGMGTWKGQHIDQMGVFTPTGLPGGTGDFPVTYIFKDSNGCTDSATVVVKVQDPVVLKISNDTAVCINTGKFILKANYSPGTWSGAAPNILNPLTGEFTPLLDGVYTLTYSYGTGTCKREATMKVTVWKLPTIAVTAAKPEICIGDVTTLTATGAQDYFWSPATGLSPTTGSMVQANPTATQTYTIVGTDANKCNNSTTFKLTVNQLPLVKAPRDTVFCNQPVIEDLSKFPGLIPLTGGTWAIVKGPGSITTDGKFTPNGIGMVTVVRTFKDTKNCENTDTMLINIIEPATIKMPNDTFVCIKSPILGLQAMPPGLIGKWTSVPAKVTSDGKFDPDQEGTYTLTFTVAGGDKTCERKGTMIIIVNPLPKPQIAGDNKICLKDSTTLMVTDLSSTLTTYAWGPPDSGLSDYDKSTVKASPTQNTTYTVTVTNSNGCTNTATFSLTIDPLPDAKAFPKTLCNQKIGELIIGSPLPGAGEKGEWSGPNISKAGIFTPLGTPAGLGDFKVCYTFTDQNGCVDSACTVVTVKDPEILKLPKDTAVCINSGVLDLIANITPTGGVWTCSPLPALVTPDGKFDPSTDGDYVLTYTYSSGTCLRTATMKIKVNALPEVEVKGANVLCFGDTTTLTASGAASYVWAPATALSATSGAVVKAYPTDMTFAYTVTGTDGNKCANSATINILVPKT